MLEINDNNKKIESFPFIYTQQVCAVGQPNW